jgi:hypothetical protein
VRVLSNSCIGRASSCWPSGWQVALLSLGEPTEGYDFDTIILSPDDAVAIAAWRDGA